MRIKPAMYTLQQLAHPLLHFAVVASSSPIHRIPLSLLHPRSAHPLLHFAVAASLSPIHRIPLSLLHPRSTNYRVARLFIHSARLLLE
jgi:hypothetical protein